jgi:hypothetical protein
MTQAHRRLLALMIVWGLAATAAGGFGLLGRLPRVGAPVLVVGLTVGFGVAIRRVAWLGAAARTLKVRWILSAHLLRFLGFYFLWLQARGRLPVEFAQRAGWGDVIAASGALALLFFPEGPGFAVCLYLWNWLGVADLALAVGTAAWLSATRPGSVNELAMLPLTLVPLWLVPLLATSHFVLLARGAAIRPAESAPFIPGR